MLSPGYAHIKNHPSDWTLALETNRSPLDLGLFRIEQFQEVQLQMAPTSSDPPQPEDRQHSNTHNSVLPQTFKCLVQPYIFGDEAKGDFKAEPRLIMLNPAAGKITGNDKHEQKGDLSIPLSSTLPIGTTYRCKAHKCKAHGNLPMIAQSSMAVSGMGEEQDSEVTSQLEDKYKVSPAQKRQVVAQGTMSSETSGRTCDPPTQEETDRRSELDPPEGEETEGTQHADQRVMLRTCMRRLVELEEQKEKQLREEVKVVEQNQKDILGQLQDWHLQCQRWQAEEQEARKLDRERWERLTISFENLAMSIASAVHPHCQKMSKATKTNKPPTSKNSHLGHKRCSTSRLKCPSCFEAHEENCYKVSSLRRAYAPPCLCGSSQLNPDNVASLMCTGQGSSWGTKPIQRGFSAKCLSKTQHKPPSFLTQTRLTRMPSSSKVVGKDLM
ncbi:hypothetical protein NDU88_001959 [Pleurodeles waltl]|uniref:Uncharacterized protein n=1 Tax=Pleurodeles waltl TaxID=8319 RepID=A0AAV7U8G2_PLEWA|nr:hypothetical protein NDU88_001959 [Pleurodeles waltl]